MLKWTRNENRYKSSTPPAPLVYCVVLNYNGLDLNDICISSLLETNYPNYKILFVDNGSSDESVERVRNQFPSVEILENGSNLLFAEGNNRGILVALQQGADYIFILNNDTKTDPSCLSLLISFMEEMPQAGACQPLLCRMDNPELIASAGCRISLSGRAWDDYFNSPSNSLGSAPRQVTGVTGGAMLARAEVLRKVGLFDEKYRMYFEDVDLSLRIRKEDYSLYIVPQAKVLHSVSATTNAYSQRLHIQLSEANSYRIILTHFPLSLAFFSYPLSLLFSLGVALRAVLRGSIKQAGAAIRGFATGIFLLIPTIITRVRSKSYHKTVDINAIDWQIIFPPKSQNKKK